MALRRTPHRVLHNHSLGIASVAIFGSLDRVVRIVEAGHAFKDCFSGMHHRLAGRDRSGPRDHRFLLGVGAKFGLAVFENDPPLDELGGFRLSDVRRWVLLIRR